MNHNPLIEVLEANHLLQSPDEVTIFEQTLAELAQNPDPADLPGLHLILDDACKQPKVMFSLVHFLESFDVQAQVQTFIQVMPNLVKRAAEWMAILHTRITNDAIPLCGQRFAIAHKVFEEKVQLISEQEKLEIQRSLSFATENESLVGCK